MNSSRLIKVSLVQGDKNETSGAQQALEGSRQFVVDTQPIEEAHLNLAGEAPDVIVLELAEIGEAELQALTQIRYAQPQTPLLLVSYEIPADAFRKILKFNVHDWLKKPLDAAEFRNTLVAVARNSGDRSNSVHAVVSCVGGAGATTLAISMADILARKLMKKGSSVALFDLDFSTGDCGNMLNLPNRFDLASVASTPRKIDSEFLHVIQKRHESGFALYSFKRPSLNTNPNAYEMVLRLLDAVSVEHEATILDIPYYTTEWRDDVFAAVNGFTLVTDQNLPAMKHALDQIDTIRDQRGPEIPIHVMINRTSSGLFGGGRLSKRRIRELLPDTPFTLLPDEPQLFGEALDRGVIPSSLSGRARILKALTKYAKSLSMNVGKKA